MFTRLIPKDPDKRPTFWDMASAHHWHYLAMIEPDPENVIPGEHVFQPQGANVKVRLVDDYLSELKYALLESDDEGELAAIEDDIRDTLEIYDDDEILDMYPRARTADEQVIAIRLAGVGAAGAFDPRFFEMFRAALIAEHPAVRLAALGAVAYPGWPQLEPLVADRVSDPDEDIRHNAAIMLQAMREQSN